MSSKPEDSLSDELLDFMSRDRSSRYRFLRSGCRFFLSKDELECLLLCLGFGDLDRDLDRLLLCFVSSILNLLGASAFGSASLTLSGRFITLWPS